MIHFPHISIEDFIHTGPISTNCLNSWEDGRVNASFQNILL